MYRWLSVGILAVLVTACNLKVGLQDDDEDNGDDEEPEEIVQRLQGTWNTACLPSGNLWFNETYVFRSSGVTWTVRDYSESTCVNADTIIEYRGGFEIDDEITAADGQAVHEIDFDYDDIEVTRGDADTPARPYRRYNIVDLRDNDSGFFLGLIDNQHPGDSASTRPDEVDFSVEYVRQ